jgi:hypothetical protein
MGKGKGKEAEWEVEFGPFTPEVKATPGGPYDPFLADAMVSPGSLYPYNPYFDDGWVSDEEGHPDLTRISPCTFARWAAGCAPTGWSKSTGHSPKPVIPARSSSLGCLDYRQYNNKASHSPPPLLTLLNILTHSPLIQSPIIQTPPRPDAPLITGFDAAQTIREIASLKRELDRLVNDKQRLRQAIEELREERDGLRALIGG